MKTSIENHRILGTRVTVWDVLHHLEHNWSHQEITRIFRLSLAQVQAAVDYVCEQQEEVMDVHRRIEACHARGNPPEIQDKLAASPRYARSQQPATSWSRWVSWPIPKTRY